MKHLNLSFVCGAVGALLCLNSAAHAQTPVLRSSDTQLWTDASLSTTLDKEQKTTLSLLTINRVGDDVSRFTDRRLGVQLLQRVSPNLQLGGSYQYRQADPSSSRTNHENRFSLNATLNAPLGKRFNLVNRNLLERRDNDDRPDRTVYRNRTPINYPTKIGQTAVTPFVAAEVFYDFKDNDLFLTRYVAGIGRQFSPNFGADIYYLRQNALGNRSGDANILGFSFRFRR